MARHTLLVAFLVVLAGCGSAVSTSEQASTPTVSPAPVPSGEARTPTTRAEPPFPPGLTGDSVDARTLASATGRRLAGNYTWTFDRLESRPEFSLGSVYVGPRLRANVSSPTHYTLTRATVNARGGGLSIQTFENATYVTENWVLTRDRNGTNRRPTDPTDDGRPARLAVTYVRTYLAVENVTVERFENGSSVLRGSEPTVVNGSDYQVRAFVDPDGVVLSFAAVYSQDGQVQFAEFDLARAVPFSPPAWARENTTRSSGRLTSRSRS